MPQLSLGLKAVSSTSTPGAAPNVYSSTPTRQRYSGLVRRRRCIGCHLRAIPSLTVVRDLGVWFNAELSVSSHFSRVTQTYFYHLRRIHAVRRQLGRDVTARLVTALVLSYLDYCNSVLAGLPASSLAPFQRVLHAAARTVLDLKPHDRVTLALQELHWLSVAEKIPYKLCLLVHKSLLGHTPEYISDLLTSVANIPGRSTLRASSCGNPVVPWTRRRIGDRAFSVAALRAWNGLPTELKLLRSSDSFCRDLKTFLFDSVYRHQDMDCYSI